MPDGPNAFEDEQACIARLEWLRWRGVPRCLKCGSEQIVRVTRDPIRTDRWQCNRWDCRTTFSIRQGTIFHGSQVPLRIWFEMIQCVLDRTKKVTAAGMARRLGVSRAAASKMLRAVHGAAMAGGEDALREIAGAPRATENRKQKTENRKQKTENRKQKTENRKQKTDSLLFDSMSIDARKELAIPPSHPRFIADSDGLLGMVEHRDPKRKGEKEKVLPVGNVRDFVRLGGTLRFRPSESPQEEGWLVLGVDRAGKEYPVYNVLQCHFRTVGSLKAAKSYIRRMRAIMSHKD